MFLGLVTYLVCCGFFSNYCQVFSMCAVSRCRKLGVASITNSIQNISLAHSLPIFGMAYQTVGSSMTHLLHVLVQKMGITLEYLLKQPTASSRSEWLKERIKINTVVTDCSKYLCLSIHMFFCLEHAHVSVCVCVRWSKWKNSFSQCDLLVCVLARPPST